MLLQIKWNQFQQNPFLHWRGGNASQHLDALKLQYSKQWHLH